MNYFISVLIFSLVLFLYIHIYHHYKTSNDLEVYTLDDISNDKLEETCSIRQPFVFSYKNEELMGMFDLDFLTNKFGNFDIKIRNVKNVDEDGQMYLPFQLDKSRELLSNDKKNKFITEKNMDFIEETGLIRFLELSDEFLKPPLLSKSNYDFVCASKNNYTPLRYNLDYRNYIYANKGRLDIKLICPNDSKYLNKIKDYENFEFRSPINPWNVQDIYKNDYGKVKTINIVLEEGQFLYLPAYWWYSVKFTEKSSYLMFNYRTYMNNIAILPDIVIHFLQNQNTKHNVLKKFEYNMEEPEVINLEEEKSSPVEIKLDKLNVNNPEETISLKSRQQVDEEKKSEITIKEEVQNEVIGKAVEKSIESLEKNTIETIEENVEKIVQQTVDDLINDATTEIK